tara:strand:- start:2848 stop:3837 length:990 start_codon:yes stop_codon:yes gene_type:complete
MSIDMSKSTKTLDTQSRFSLASIMEHLKNRRSGYDLPLNKSSDTKFLLVLVTLMVFLTVLALSGSLALRDMSKRWSSGLENKVTIEIPIETKDGHLLSQDTVRKETRKLKTELENHPFVKSAHIVEDKEIGRLLDPWIGEDLLFSEVPLPGLIAIEIRENTPIPITIDDFRKDLAEMSHYANLEDHQEWLGELIRFAAILQSLAMIIAVIIIGTTVTAIIAAVRARMSIHKKEVELLHLIGAPDKYIARQFQRHMTIIAFQGSVLGTFLGLLAVFILMVFSTFIDSPLIPSLEISFISFIILLSFPLFFPAIASVTAYQTVLRSLKNMP